MEAKRLLLTATLFALGAIPAKAQAVYSVNIVGYINKTLNPGLTLLANQLNTLPNNSVQTLFGTPPGPITIDKFNPSAGNFDQAAYDPEGGWSDPTSMVLNPGQGAFVDNAGPALTLTLVGEVQLNSVVTIHPGIDIYSSVLPVAGSLPDILGFPVPLGSVTVCRFNGSGFDCYAYDLDINDWIPTRPSVEVAEAFFIDNAGGILAWTRNFTVGP